MDTAKASKDAVEKMVTKNATAITANDNAITAAEAS